MASSDMTRAQAIETLNLLNKYPTLVAAARAIGLPRTTLQSRRINAEAILQNEPPPETHVERDPIIIQKPRVRVQAGRAEGARYKVLGIGDAHDHPTSPRTASAGSAGTPPRSAAITWSASAIS
jgi:hypothetical protein